MSNIRRVIREIVEDIFLSEAKRKKKNDKSKSFPVFSRNFFFGGYASDGDMGGDAGFGGGDIGGGMEEGFEPIEITTLSFFDFDGCLVDSPEPEQGKKRYKELTGEEWPFTGWWGKELSLNAFSEEIKSIDKVVFEYNKRKNEPNSKIILLTNRLKKLSVSVEKILSNLNFVFDAYSYKEDSKEKSQRIIEFLKQYPNVKNINVYDDRDKEIELFKIMKKDLENDGFSVNVFQVKK